MELNGPQREVLQVTPEEARLLRRLQEYRADLPRHMVECLRVVDKRSRLSPLALNNAQRLIHAKVEAQRAEHGMVRAIVLKGRKQGASTYIGARFYSLTRLWKHRHAKVMAHIQDSTDTLFDMVQNFYKHDPLRLRADTSNAKQYKFSNGSSYTVATAGGSGESGRGSTPTLGHMSEVAFYRNAAKNFAGFANAIPVEPGTENFVESTANGLGNEFHQRWVKAEAGMASDEAGGVVRYIPIFTPWWLSDEYRLPVPRGFQLRPEPEGDGLPSERDIAEMYGLSLEQMAWRRFQLEEALGGSVETFMQEYPCTAAEAFQTTGVDLFIKPIYVMLARKRTGIRPEGPRILGVDPAGLGGDKFCMTERQGMVATWTEGRIGVDPQEAIHWVGQTIRDRRPDRVNIDNGGGWGASLLSGLRAHYPDIAERCFAVDFGGTSQFKQVKPHAPGPRNRRAEMYQRMQTWFMAPEGCICPDSDVLAGDLGAIAAKITGQSTDLLLEPKTEVKKRLGRSPDESDSLALTFAFPDSSITAALTDDRPAANQVFAEGQSTAAPVARPMPRSPAAPTPLGRFDSGGSWMGAWGLGLTLSPLLWHLTQTSVCCGLLL